MDNLTLIHLVSEQTMQNLLPTIALRPARVIQVRSSDPRFEKTPSFLETACKTAGLTNIEFLPPETIQDTSPGIIETYDFLTALCKKWTNTPVYLNVTGATKLMSIGAYLVAKHLQLPSFYTDTQTRRNFVNGNTGEFSEALPNLQELLSRINVPTVLAAQGKAPGDWRGDTVSEKELSFGRIAWELRSQHSNDFTQSKFGEKIRDFFRRDEGKFPKKLEDLQTLTKLDLLESLEDPIPNSIIDYLHAAVHAGYLQTADSGFILTEGPEQKDKLKSHIEKINNILVGSWLELAVLSFLNRSPAYHDTHWSVEATKQGQDRAEYGETDIVTIHTNSSSLEIISCKTSLGGPHGPQPLEHLEGLRTRANNLGGNHSRATLAVFSHPNPIELQKRGKLLKVNVIVGEEIPKYINSPK